MNDMIPVFEAVSMIQRDAILAHLEDLGFVVEGMERDISRRYSDSSVDIAFEGYSALMGGFKIFVEKERAEEAKRVIREYLERVERDHPPTTPVLNLNRFYLSAMASIVIPIFLPFGIYYLYRGLMKGEARRPALFGFTLVIFVIVTVLWSLSLYFIGRDYFSAESENSAIRWFQENF